MTKEEVMSKLTELAVDMLVSEQHVFELSKKTLGSYVSKSAKKLHSLGVTSMVAKKDGDDDTSTNVTDKAISREKGVDKAVKRLTKEDLDTVRFPEVSAVLNLIK